MGPFQPEQNRVPDHLPLDIEGMSLPTREVHDLYDQVMQMRQAQAVPFDDPELLDLVEQSEDLTVDLLTELLWRGKDLQRKFSVHMEKANVTRDGCVYLLLDVVDSNLRSLIPVCEFDDETQASARMEKIDAATRLLITVDPNNALTTADPRYLISPMFSAAGFEELFGNFSRLAEKFNSNVHRAAVTNSSDIESPSYLMRRLIDEVKFQIARGQERLPSDKHVWLSDIKKIEVQPDHQVLLTVAVNEFEAKRGFNPNLREVIAHQPQIERHRFVVQSNQFGFVNLLWLGVDRLAGGTQAEPGLGEAA